MAFQKPESKADDPYFLRPYSPENTLVEQQMVDKSPRARFLYRVVTERFGSPVVVVRSELKPDWEYAFQNADYLLAARPEPQMIDWSVLQEGEKLQFSIRANTVQACKTKGQGRQDGGKSKRHDVAVQALKSASPDGAKLPDHEATRLIQESCFSWLKGKGEVSGFEPFALFDPENPAEDATRIAARSKMSFHKQRHGRPEDDKPLTLNYTDFVGTLRVTDRSKFVEMLDEGLGPAKAFGCGLMLIRRA